MKMKVISYEKVTYEIDDGDYVNAIGELFLIQNKLFSSLASDEKADFFESIADKKKVEVLDFINISNT